MPYQPGGNDPFRIPKKEAAWHYRWLGDDAQRLSQHLLGHADRPGYKIIQGKTVPETVKIAEKLGLPEAYVDRLKNRIVYGRCILAKIPLVEYQSRMRERTEDQQDRLRASKDDFYDTAARRGVRPFIKEKEEVDDRRKFATRDDDPIVSFAGVDIPKTEPAPSHGEAPAD